MIDKTDAAKYEVTWGMRPHMVSAGAQKNFMAFANLVAAQMGSRGCSIQRVVLEAARREGHPLRIHPRRDRKGRLVREGILANIVTYTMAKLAFEVGQQARGGAFDLERDLDRKQSPSHARAP